MRSIIRTKSREKGLNDIKSCRLFLPTTFLQFSRLFADHEKWKWQNLHYIYPFKLKNNATYFKRLNAQKMHIENCNTSIPGSNPGGAFEKSPDFAIARLGLILFSKEMLNWFGKERALLEKCWYDKIKLDKAFFMQKRMLIYMDYKEKLLQLRKSQGLTQEELA